MKAARIAGICLASLVAVCATLWLAGIYLNNRDTPAPEQADLHQAYERGVAWLINHQHEILTDDNHMLWWMVMRAGTQQRDARLAALIQAYDTRYWSKNMRSLWRPLFRPYARPPVNIDTLVHLPDYNLLLLQGINCDDTLGELPVIKAQLQADFCPSQHPLSPACATHQLMGIRMMQTSRCGDTQALEQLSSKLLDDIERQLQLDPRLVDVYIQRALMLTDAPSPRPLKAVWIQRILKAQRPDGGWAGAQPLLALGGDAYLALGAKLPEIGPLESNFHTTAQAVLLMSLLMPAPL